MKKASFIAGVVIFVVLAGYAIFYVFNHSNYNPNSKYAIGTPLDSFNGVIVHYNGMVGHTGGRNIADDGYNLGMKYQCVEFVKRYYYQRFNHKMPDSYGNAKDFFDTATADGSVNRKRNLLQFANGSNAKPQAEDLIIFNGHIGNPYGHVAIISSVTDTNLQIIQQNPGPFAASRISLSLSFTNNKWCITHPRVLGWLRKDTILPSDISNRVQHK